MLKNLLLTMTAGAILAGATAATTFASSAGNTDQSKGNVVTFPSNKTTPVSGKQMFGNYCAPCHGLNGKGNGPVGVALRSRPTDLTALSKNNGGKFPSNHVLTILKYGIDVPAHGTSEMPVWGPVLGKMDQANPQTRQLRISNLSSYLETIQAK
jgi:mono/diheme cytochrome c family protein